mgnify:CR=1 FL=1
MTAAKLGRHAFLAAALTLCGSLSPVFAAFVLPTAGLPEGKVAATPFVSARQSSLGTWNILRDFTSSLGASLSISPSLAGLDQESGRFAAGALLAYVPSTLWADVVMRDQLSPERQAALLSAFTEAEKKAAQAAVEDVSRGMSRAEEELAAGRFGVEDLKKLSTTLKGLAPYHQDIRTRYEEVFAAAAEQSALRLKGGILVTAQNLGTARILPPGTEVAGSESKPAGAARLGKPTPKGDRLAKAATYAGYGLWGVSAVALVHPAIGADPGLLTWMGVALTSFGKYLHSPSPRGPPEAAPPAAAETVKPSRVPSWISGRLESLQALWRNTKESLRLHDRFEKGVGGASGAAFKKWVSSGLRAAFYIFPLALLGMLVGSVIGMPLKWLAPGLANLAGSFQLGAADMAGDLSLWGLVNGYLAPQMLQEILFLGLGFNALLWLSRKAFGTTPRATVIAGAAALALYIPAVVALGYPVAIALTMAGIEAFFIYAYARSGTLLIPVAARAAIAFTSIGSVRMITALQETVTGTLAGTPAWTSLAVAGMSLAAFAAWSARTQLASGWSFLKVGAKAQLARLKDFGQWWTKPTPDGAPKSFLPALSLGLLWAVPLYLVMDFAYTGVHLMVPQAEPTPEILRRLLLMPIDVIIYNFIIVAALEEWVFRKGVFKPMVERLKKWGAPSKWWFWPAALVSSLIFSGAHYIDWSAMLAHLGMGGDPAIGASLAGAYAFTWASFTARAVGGMLLSFLYARSGLLMVPMIAHFGSNFLESIGMRWGLAAFLSAIAAVFLLHLFTPKTK